MRSGVNGATHMGTGDATKVFKIMTDGGHGEGGVENAVAVAVHWGTFVTDPAEVLRTLGGLELACEREGVGFGRSLEACSQDDGGERRRGRFVALNHGQSVVV